jgi:two-component system cell cycle response regulator
MPEEEQTVCISLCETVAKKLGRELERLNVHSHVEKKSLTDKLTGLYNRQFFDDAIEQEFQKAKENGTNLAYVMLDLDYFKQMNDCHGHDFGDKVLMLASEIFSRNIRKTDFACRTGGDEFSLIITDASKEAVYEIVKRIRSDYANAVEKYNLYAEKDGKPVKSSLSIGVAVYPHPKAVSATTLVKLADLAVYHVKKNGKNSFCFVK